jgi:hypothetical protein
MWSAVCPALRQICVLVHVMHWSRDEAGQPGYEADGVNV